jgi:2-polyprenyl-3-methyl-5-hydroxy-6-metoxy-1,4-benzoquinol methylase
MIKQPIENYITGKRFQKSLPEIDKAEQDWWNEFSSMQETLWGYNSYEPAHRISRGYYLSRMSVFLTEEKKDAEILEIGCGTGWVGHFLARKGARIWGTDYAANALDIARVNAKIQGISENTKYTTDSLNALAEKGAMFDGVIIHAVLHHLSFDEIDEMLSDLKKVVKKGGRIFIYEHVRFSNQPQTAVAKAVKKSQILMIKLHSKISSYMLKKRLIPLEHIAISERAGYWAKTYNSVGGSPKEFPFEESELEQIIAKQFRVNKTYICTVMNYLFVQLPMLSTSKLFRFILLQTLVRFTTLYDRILLTTRLARYVDPTIRYLGWPFLGIEAINE